MVDHLDCTLFVLAGLEVERACSLKCSELLGINTALERFADLLPWVGRLGWKVSLTHQKGRAVVVGIEEPGCKLIGAGCIKVAGVGVVNVDALHRNSVAIC